MASIQLTQVFLAQSSPENPDQQFYVVQTSGYSIAINPAHLVAVGEVYNANGSVVAGARQIYLTGGGISSLYVSDSYATVKAYIDAL